MKTLIGGAIGTIIGVVYFSTFFMAFLKILAGVIPLMLIIGGGLAIYLNYESALSERKEKKDGSSNTGDEELSSPAANQEATPSMIDAEPIDPVEIKQAKAETEEIESQAATPVKQESSESEPEEKTPVNPSDGVEKLLGNTGSLVFHTPDCNFSKSKKCTAVFNTREEAIQEGYKPCSKCEP